MITIIKNLSSFIFLGLIVVSYSGSFMPSIKERILQVCNHFSKDKGLNKHVGAKNPSNIFLSYLGRYCIIDKYYLLKLKLL